MDTSTRMLSEIENNHELKDTDVIQKKLNLKYERNARIMLHILENKPEKYQENLTREVNKLEKKIDKEYRKIQKQLTSYNSSFPLKSEQRIGELQSEIKELQAFI